MAAPSRACPSCLSALTATNLARAQTPRLLPPSFLLPLNTTRSASNSSRPRRKDAPDTQKRKKARTSYQTHDLKKVPQFSLVDAMRYLRAFEVGRPPSGPKYELHIKLATPKNGAVVRNRVRLPHPVRTDMRICVICAPDSRAARAAQAAGAAVVGDEAVFAAIKDGKIEFDRCIAHVDSVAALNGAGVARILGPRGLMPSVKTGTVVRDVEGSVRELVGGSEYRERVGVVRMAVGQIGFGPEELQRNIRAFVGAVKRDIAAVAERTPKEVHEVVLSSTHGPGFSLSGELRGVDSVPNTDVSTL